MDPFQEIKKTIVAALPDAEIEILDPYQDGVHIQALVSSKSFIGKSLREQHQMVMRPLKDHFQAGLHALGLKTFTPDQWQQRKK